jgi:hypothetical protein
MRWNRAGGVGTVVGLGAVSLALMAPALARPAVPSSDQSLFSEQAPASATGVPRPDHVVVVVEENEAVEDVLGSPDAPYLTSLAAAGADQTNFFAETHPSQPNYLALFSGSTQGITNDSCPHTFAGDNLGSELLAAGETFVGYAEGLPAVGSTVCSKGRYVRRHNPWVNFSNVPATSNRPFTDFPTDFSQLPTVSFVTPNLDHDMHDGTVAAGDAWLEANLGAYADWALTHNSLLVVTFDEDDGGHHNQIPTLVVGQQVQPGGYDDLANHYSLLRTLEDAYGLTSLGASATVLPLLDIWKPPDGDQLPVPVFTSSCAGLSCSFEGSGSWDPDGSVVSYAWSFGDGGVGGGVSPTHLYGTGGPVQVTLTAIDDRGGSSSVTQTVSPDAGPPFVSDAFARTVSRGLGTADVGGAWSTVGALSQFSVAPGGAVLNLGKAGQQLEGFVGPARTDADVTVMLSANRLPVGGPLYLTVTGRRVAAGTSYSARLVVDPTGSVRLRLTRTSGGADTTLGRQVTVSGLTYGAGMSLSVRVQVTGTSPTTVRARVWPTGETSPTTWQVTGSDSTTGLQTGGAVGSTAKLSGTATNAPLAVTLTSFVAGPTGSGG